MQHTDGYWEMTYKCEISFTGNSGDEHLLWDPSKLSESTGL